MNRWLVVGATLLAVGLVGVFAPGLTAWVPSATSVPLFIAVAAGVMGLVAVRRRSKTDPAFAQPPERERYAERPTPGAEFDETLASVVPFRSWADDRRQERVRERLRGVAVDVLATEGLSETLANERLDEGTWTDDPVAAAFFLPADPNRRFDEQVRDLFDPTPAFVRRARRVVTVLDDRTPDDDRSRTRDDRRDRNGEGT